MRDDKAVDSDTHDDPTRGQRLDKWLWHARFARTRSAAAQLVADGHVRINARRELTCAKRLRDGDVLTIALGRDVKVVRLCGFSERRGPASSVGALYRSLTETGAERLDQPV